MKNILFTGLILLCSLTSYSQTNTDDILSRFNSCDTTITEYDLLNLMFTYRNIDNINGNDGFFDKMKSLELDSAFSEIEVAAIEKLKSNPTNITALYYYTLSQLRLTKYEDLQCAAKKSMLIYNTVMEFGDGSSTKPYIVCDKNDALAFIYLYWTIGVKIDKLLDLPDGLLVAYITNSENEKEEVYFNFNKNLNVRDIYFDYNRDFKYYLSESTIKGSRYNYETLLARFQAEDTTLKNNEILALMIGFTANPDYKAYTNVAIENEIFKLIREKEFKQAKKKCEEFLSTNPLNFTALIEHGFAMMKLENDRTYYPSVKANMVIDAVFWSGNGTYYHPYFVLSPIDGQTMISYFIDGNIGSMGSGYDMYGNFLDILHLEREGEKPYPLYFIIEHAMDSDMGKSIDEAVKKLQDK